MTEAEERERYRYLQLKAKMAQAAPAQPEAPAVAAPPDVGVAETLLNSTGKALPGGHVLSNAMTALGLSGSHLLPSGSLFGVDFGDSGTRARLSPQARAMLAAGVGNDLVAQNPKDVVSPIDAAERARLLAPAAAPKGLVDNYRTARDRLAERSAAGTQQNPWASGIGTGIGTALSLAAPLPKVTVGSGATGRILSNALTAGGYGALNGALNSRGDLTRGDVGQVLKDTVGVEGLQRAAEDWKAGHKGRAVLDVMGAGGVGGALTGGVLGAGVEVARRPLQAALQGVSGGLDRFAGRKALNALGAMKPELNRLGSEEANALGQYALEKGIVSPLASRATMAERVNAARQAAGGRMGDALAELDAAALPSERVLSSPAAAQRVEQLAEEVGQKPALRNIANKFRTEAENIRAAAPAGQTPGGMSLQDFEETVARPYKQTTNWNTDLALPKETLKQLPRALERQVESAAEPIAKRIGSDALERYRAGKGDYGKLAELRDIAEEGLKRQASNHTISLKDAVMAAPAVLLGHGSPSSLAMGAGGLLASKLANRFGDQLMATGANRMSTALRAADLAPDIARTLNARSAAALAPAEKLRLLQYAQALRGEAP